MQSASARLVAQEAERQRPGARAFPPPRSRKRQPMIVGTERPRRGHEPARRRAVGPAGEVKRRHSPAIGPSSVGAVSFRTRPQPDPRDHRSGPAAPRPTGQRRAACKGAADTSRPKPPAEQHRAMTATVITPQSAAAWVSTIAPPSPPMSSAQLIIPPAARHGRKRGVRVMRHADVETAPAPPGHGEIAQQDLASDRPARDAPRRSGLKRRPSMTAESPRQPPRAPGAASARANEHPPPASPHRAPPPAPPPPPQHPGQRAGPAPSYSAPPASRAPASPRPGGRRGKRGGRKRHGAPCTTNAGKGASASTFPLPCLPGIPAPIPKEAPTMPMEKTFDAHEPNRASMPPGKRRALLAAGAGKRRDEKLLLHHAASRPNVGTGALHVGHRLQPPRRDATFSCAGTGCAGLRHRSGQPGQDHAGIATQLQVEKKAEGPGGESRRADLSRAESSTGLGLEDREGRNTIIFPR